MRIVHCPLLATAIVFPLSLLGSAYGATPENLGTFKVNGKDARIGYAGLVAMNPTNGVPRMILVLGEKAPPTGTAPDAASDAGSLGPTLLAPIVDYPDKGWSAPTGFSYLHPAAKTPHGWCAASRCMLENVVVKDGEFSAHLVSVAPPDATGDSIVLDLHLRTKMP